MITFFAPSAAVSIEGVSFAAGGWGWCIGDELTSSECLARAVTSVEQDDKPLALLLGIIVEVLRGDMGSNERL